MSHIDLLIEKLPPSLQERTRASSRTVNAAGEYVLYWMHHAVRAEENPALDVAIHLANRLRLPVFIYHAISERCPYASDRHHTFMLEGARDIQSAIQQRRVGYVFHLQRPGQRGPDLRSLATEGALLVTEDMPVDPLRKWTESLIGTLNLPVVRVDTACVVPMQLVRKCHTRAFAFRRDMERLYAERVSRSYMQLEPDGPPFIPARLPFEPVPLSDVSLPALVRECDIDHTIGPVPHTVGGSRAGYERWRAFVERGLAAYARRRNDALTDGVSRMSAYLHYGMVSPFRLAREAAAADNSGAEKFLDELLIWRELAYSFCFHTIDHESLSALPPWARDTLAEHAADPRPAYYSWETLARGQTGDLLWDAAQRSLLMHGELHNNVRMTWGKALLNWTPDASAALAAMIDLNHRYALDGRDPASYGGILWCLGQFDRPFPPPRPIFGTVRDRSTKQHAARLDPQRFMRHATRSLVEMPPSVAVIGAGISGLMCARTLMDHGLSVVVLEKSRGVGGRMATRRADEELSFDHGAQYFTIRDATFRRYVDAWRQGGFVAPWEGRIVSLQSGHVVEGTSHTSRYVAVPGMNAVCKHLSQGLDIRFGTGVAGLAREGPRWRLRLDNHVEINSFDVVMVATPAAQAAEVLRAAQVLSARARACAMHGCWAVMAAFREPLRLEFEGAFVQDSPLAWVARNSSKPGRPAVPETWVLHATPAWTNKHLEDDGEGVSRDLLAAFWQATGRAPRELDFRVAHRWRYALPSDPLEDSCLWDAGLRLGACGDWCRGPRVEGAFLSGTAAAGSILGLLSPAAATRIP